MIVSPLYVAMTEEVLQQGNLAFRVAYTDTVGNTGVPVTAIAGAAAGVSAASSATDRLHAGSVQFDTFVPTVAGDPSLKYASQDEVAANVPAFAAAFHAVQQVTTGAAAYRLAGPYVSL
jgi:hypothetical protein